MKNYDEVARETLQKIDTENYWKNGATSKQVLKGRESFISSALLSAYQDGVEESAKVVSEFDVIETNANWEEGEDIAYAVQREIANEIRKLLK